MSAPFEPPGPFGEDDLEARLAAAMRAEVDPVVPAGDGLSRIRARTQGRAGAFAWIPRPAAAAGILVVALVGATLVGVQFAKDDGSSVVVQPPPDPVIAQPLATGAAIPNDQATAPRYNPTPGSPIGPEGGVLPTVDTQLSAAPTSVPMLAPVTPEQQRKETDNGIPIDDGHSTYVSITAPLSNGTYDSPLTLTGQARVFEAQVTLDISQNGTVLQQAHATATQGAPALGDWQATIALPPGKYRIDAFALSPKDGATRLASDSIWITVRAPAGTPTPSPPAAARPTSGPSATARPTSIAQPGDVPSDVVPVTEPQ